jgi:putative tricarboxylic transport membrane protein
MLDGILLGLYTVATPTNLMLVLLGCLVGTFIGMLPGLGPISAIALMIPITYGFDPAAGMILLAGVYYGAVFGGSTSSILINAPGIAGTVASAFDGYPLARSGEPGKALAVAAYSSFAGGTLAAVMLIIAAPVLSDLSLSFQSADYFALMLLGLSLVAAFAGPDGHLKALLMTCFGIMLSTIGTDLSAGVQRFTFGRMDLIDGISFLLLAMATFALAEALMMVLRPTQDSQPGISVRTSGLKLNQAELKQIAPVVGRSSILGFFVGILPGAGATIASFLAYGMERLLANPVEQLQFGKGSLKGLAAPETANNAACTGSFVPLLTLGIPGSGTTAILLGALLAYGIQPGPRLFVDEPQVFWAVIVSMYFGNIILLVLNLPLIPYIARILMLPRVYLIPAILFFSLIGVYLVSFNSFDIHMMVFIAVIAVGLRLLEFPMAPLLLGFILGGMMEDNLRRAITLSDGSFTFLLDRPSTVILLGLAALTLFSPLLRRLYRSLMPGN